MRTNSKFMFVLSCVSLITLQVSVAQADTQCFDFDNLDPGAEYGLGDSTSGRHATINFVTMNPENPPINEGYARYSGTNLPQVGAPSLAIARLRVQIVPDKPVQSISLHYAENAGALNNQVWNLGTNGVLYRWTGQLSRFDDRSIGRNPANLVLVTVTSEPMNDGSDWIVGTLTMEAEQPPGPGGAGIHAISIGRSSQLVIDNVCITEKQYTG